MKASGSPAAGEENGREAEEDAESDEVRRLSDLRAVHLTRGGPPRRSMWQPAGF